jgi:hypothetical protein
MRSDDIRQAAAVFDASNTADPEILKQWASTLRGWADTMQGYERATVMLQQEIHNLRAQLSLPELPR